MEQRTGSITPAIHPAGLDPAFVPGLLPPRPAADEVNASDPAEAVPPDDAPAEEADTAEVTPAAAEPDPAEEPLEAEDEEDRGEPLFEVSDRRATILADRVGIVFRLDGEEADFTWDEIGAVEIDTPRFGKRFAVTVYTGPRRWFEAHVEAKSRGLLKTWTAELDAVLDEHFEDPDEKAGAEEPEAEESAVAEAPAGTDTDTRADADADATSEDADATSEDTDTDTDTDATDGAKADSDAKDEDAKSEDAS